MFRCCFTAKNTIRFSVSHSLTSLFCFVLFSPATYEVLTSPHSLAFACLALVIFLAFSFPFFFIFLHHSCRNLPQHCFSSFDHSPCILRLLCPPPHSSFLSFALFFVIRPLLISLHHFFSLLSLQEVARSANMVFARRSSADVFLPDRPGQPTATSSPQASPPTYPQSVSPLHKELKTTEEGRAYNRM